MMRRQQTHVAHTIEHHKSLHERAQRRHNRVKKADSIYNVLTPLPPHNSTEQVLEPAVEQVEPAVEQVEPAVEHVDGPILKLNPVSYGNKNISSNNNSLLYQDMRRIENIRQRMEKRKQERIDARRNK